jgi:uncharacterized protein (TIGR02145 family)
MKNKTNLLLLLLCISFAMQLNKTVYSQKEIAALLPIDGSINVNVGILKWLGAPGSKHDLYLGLSANPVLYKSDLDTTEEKPVILELNKKYFWKVVEKKVGKEIRTSKVFSFSTLPITLNPSVGYKPFVDLRDYKVYWTIKIGEKEWFAQNLDYELQDLSWYYNNSVSNKVYGKLYSGHLLTTNMEDICPEGWHIPTQQEWTDLINVCGGLKNAGPSLKETTDLYWRNSKNKRTNESGMTILPAGSRDSKPDFSNLGKYSFFWTSTPNPKIKNSFFTIDFGFMRDNGIFNPGDPNWNFSIRCVKDK